MINLRYELRDWTDFDGAAYKLGRALGLFHGEWAEGCLGRGIKYVFWSNDPLGEMLHQMLRRMADVGILLFDEEEIRFKWNPTYIAPGEPVPPKPEPTLMGEVNADGVRSGVEAIDAAFAKGNP